VYSQYNGIFVKDVLLLEISRHDYKLIVSFYVCGDA